RRFLAAGRQSQSVVVFHRDPSTIHRPQPRSGTPSVHPRREFDCCRVRDLVCLWTICRKSVVGCEKPSIRDLNQPGGGLTFDCGWSWPGTAATNLRSGELVLRHPGATINCMYHYDPNTALEELTEDATLPNPVHVRDMILRKRLTADKSLELNRMFV